MSRDSVSYQQDDAHLVARARRLASGFGQKQTLAGVGVEAVGLKLIWRL